MKHRQTHPTPVEGCFGCKVQSIGFDGRHLTRTTRDEAGHDTTEHRSGRVDVNINAKAAKVRLAMSNG
ncbi:MAG: hypothetical protein PVJ28_00210 [Acidimicrobiia bacterium]